MNIIKAGLIVAFLLELICQVYSQTYIVQYKNKGTLEWGFIDNSGKQILPPKFTKCFSFSEYGLAAVYNQTSEKYVFINLDGKFIETEVKDFKLIGEGFGVVGFKYGVVPIKWNKKWGIMNASGEVIVENKYSFISGFNDGYAIVKRGGIFLIIDTKGTEYEINAIPDAMNKFSEGLAPFRNESGVFGYVNTKGEVQIKPIFKRVGHFNSGLAWARADNGRFGFIDVNGNWVVEPIYKVVKDFDPVSEIAIVEIKRKWEYINNEGKVLDILDDELKYNFVNGYAFIRKGAKIGFIDKFGNLLIEPKFKSARNFKNGFASVKTKDGWGVIDVNGKWIIKPQYGDLKDMELVNVY